MAARSGMSLWENSKETSWHSQSWHSGSSSWSSPTAWSSAQAPNNWTGWKTWTHGDSPTAWSSAQASWNDWIDWKTWTESDWSDWNEEPTAKAKVMPQSCLRKNTSSRCGLRVRFSDRLEERTLLMEDQSATEHRKSMPPSYVDVPPWKAIFVNIYRKEVLCYMKANNEVFMDYPDLVDDVVAMKFDYQWAEHQRKIFQRPWQTVKRIIIEWSEDQRTHVEVVRTWNQIDPSA